MAHFEHNPSSVPTLGAKHICLGCEARFYDLNKQPVICPKCSKVYVPAVKRPTRRQRLAGEHAMMARADVAPKEVVKPKPVKWKTGPKR